MKTFVTLAKTLLLLGSFLILGSSIAAALDSEPIDGGHCAPPKTSQCLSGSEALGDWTPTLE